jgi:hypothetical protein
MTPYGDEHFSATLVRRIDMNILAVQEYCTEKWNPLFEFQQGAGSTP